MIKRISGIPSCYTGRTYWAVGVNPISIEGIMGRCVSVDVEILDTLDQEALEFEIIDLQADSTYYLIPNERTER